MVMESWLIFQRFLDHSSDTFFSTFFAKLVCISSSFLVSFFFGEPSQTIILLHEYSGFRGYTLFQQLVFFAKPHFEHCQNSNLFRYHFHTDFRYFSRLFQHQRPHRIFHRFWIGKWLPKWMSKTSATTFGCILVALWIPLGSI